MGHDDLMWQRARREHIERPSDRVTGWCLMRTGVDRVIDGAYESQLFPPHGGQVVLGAPGRAEQEHGAAVVGNPKCIVDR